jgi:uncharacterized membrane protein (GlpM family)
MKRITYALLAFAPVLAFAQTYTTTTSSLTGLVTSIKTLLNSIIPLFFIIAILYFFWGLVKFIMGAGDAKKVAEGKGIMIWGLVALVIMATLFGIINWLTNTAGIGGTSTVPLLPQVTQ